MSDHVPRRLGKQLAAEWTIERIRALGAVTDLVTAGAAIGIGRTKAYELARLDQFPVRILKVGHRYLVPVTGILELLGEEVVVNRPSQPWYSSRS